MASNAKLVIVVIQLLIVAALLHMAESVPLGVKCHTPQQQQQQQQQLAAATTMLMSGSEGMLTTLTTTAATAAHNNTTTGATATATATATAAATVATTTTNGNSTPSAVHTDLAKEALCGAKRAACAEVSGNPTTPSTTTAATTTFFTNVNGTCDNHKNNSNATSNNNKSYSSVKTNRINNSSSVNQQLQQQHQLGHGSATIGDVIGGRLLPVACLPSSIVSLYCAGQEVRSGVAGAGGDGADGYDFNDNGDVPAAGDIVSANDATIDGTICNNNNNSNQQLSNNNGTGHKHSNNGHGMPLALHNHTLAQQQQQQHQQQHQQQQHQQQQHQQQQQQHQHHHHHQHSKPQHLQLQSPSHAAQHPVGAVATCGNLPCHTITASVCATAMRASTGASDPYDLAMPLSLSLPLPMPLPLSTMPCRALSPAMAQCGYCCRPICDRYIMRVVDTSFHEGCLKCATCSLHLVHSCFARDGKLYCRIDYERLFLRNRCLGCGHRIAADELVMRTLECVFHLKCFACVVCGILLKKGEQYVIRQGQLFCRFDYEKEVEMLQGYDFYNDDLFAPKLDGRRGPKRPRTILNTQQRRAFKASFEMSPKPCRKVRENLAKETGLSLRIVQVWFQNQRAKVKKIQKKAKQELAKGASDSQDSQESDSSNLAKIKDETHSDGESLLESPYSSCGMGGSGGRAGSVSSTDGFVKLRTVKDENENTSFNCMETNKENCNKTNEPLLNTILGLSYSTFQQLMGPFTQSPMVNPIDRLYSMQNSYFRPEELGYSNGCARDMVEN